MTIRAASLLASLLAGIASSACGGHSQADWDQLQDETARLRAQHVALVAHRERLARVQQDAARPAAERSAEPNRAASSVQLRWPDVTAPLSLEQAASKDRALIVAIEDYEKLPDVPGAVANGEAWERFLKEVRGVPVVTSLFNGDATDYAIKLNLGRLASEVEPEGKLWFIFIGHGIESIDKKKGSLLVAVDARQSELGLEERSVPQGVVFEIMNRARGVPVAVMDACFSGRDSRGDALLPGMQATRIPPPPTPPLRGVLITAAGEDEYAGPLPGSARPAFSYLALGGLRGWADRNRDGSVNADEVAAYARAALRELVPASRRQTPEAHGDKLAPLASGSESGPPLETFARSLRGGGAW